VVKYEIAGLVEEKGKRKSHQGKYVASQHEVLKLIKREVSEGRKRRSFRCMFRKERSCKPGRSCHKIQGVPLIMMRLAEGRRKGEGTLGARADHSRVLVS